MLRCYFETIDTLHRLRAETNGVVSFEYVLVAAAIVGVVVTVFNAAAGSAIRDGLTNGINAVLAAVAAAVGA